MMAKKPGDLIEKAAGFATGTAVGAAGSAAVGVGVTKLAAGLIKVAPALAHVPYVGPVVKGGAILFAGYEALGAVSKAYAATTDTKKRPKATEAAPPSDEPVEVTRARQRVKDAQAMARRAPTQKEKDEWKRRAEAEQARYEQLATPAAPVAATTPAVEQAKPQEKSLREKVFGEAKENSFDKQRKELNEAIRLNEQMLQKEFGGTAGSGKKGVGPEVRKLQERSDALRAQMRELDKAEREAPSGFKTGVTLGLSVGALLGGGFAGHMLGKGTLAAAEATAARTTAGVEKLAEKAASLVNASKNSVIAGTIEGDKAAALVKTAEKSLARKGLTAVGAYAIPAFNVAHGAALTAYSFIRPDDQFATAARTEGMAALAMGAVGGKYAVMARQVAPVLSPHGAAKLQSAANRLRREVTKGPAGVAKAGARQAVGVAGNRASQRIAETGARSGVAKAEGVAAVGVAKAKGGAAVGVAQSQAGGRVAASKLNAQRPVINAGARSGVAKIEGIAKVKKAEVKGKLAVSRAIKRGNVPPSYKDSWQDTKGRIYHRKDFSVRKAAAKPKGAPANDTGPVTGSRRA